MIKCSAIIKWASEGEGEGEGREVRKRRGPWQQKAMITESTVYYDGGDLDFITS